MGNVCFVAMLLKAAHHALALHNVYLAMLDIICLVQSVLLTMEGLLLSTLC